MKRNIFIIVSLLAVLGGFFWLLQYTSKTPQTILLHTATQQPEPPKSTSVGNLFMVGHFADMPLASTTDLITQYDVGGIIIMSTPKNPDDIKTWTSIWQSASDKPLLIGIDQEGGIVTRLKGNDFIQTSQRDITTEAQAYAVGKKRGEELAALGINVNFAPVLDSAAKPDSFLYERVFPDSHMSARLAAAMIRGMREAGVIAVPKHFPGHADTATDSHVELPQVAIQKKDLLEFTHPFNELISNNPPAALMTAHVQFPNIDTYPATLSPWFLTTYLQNELGFSGVIVTDDMSMDAIDKNYGLAEASQQALEAGADLLLFAGDPQVVPSVIATLSTTVSTSTIAQRSYKLNALRATLP